METEEEKKTKLWYRSRTNIFGALLAALGLAIFGLDEFQAVLNSLPAEYQGLAVAVVGGVVLYLRHITAEPVSYQKPKDK